MSPIAHRGLLGLAPRLAWIAGLLAGSLMAAQSQPRLGVLEENHPFSYRDADGAVTGFAYDLLVEVERVMGLRFERVIGGTGAIHAAFERGELDALQSLAQFPEREDMADFSVPYLTMSGAIFIRNDTRDIRKLADLRGRRVLVHRGSLGETVLRRAGLEASIVTVGSLEDALHGVADGTGDATLLGRLSGLALAHHLGLDHLRAAEGEVPGYEVRYCVAVREGDRALLARINEGLAVLVRTGRHDELYQKWFGAYVPTGYSERDIQAAVAAGLTLALAVAIWAAARQRVLGRRIARQAEELRRGEARLRAVFDGTQEGLLVLRRQGDDWLTEQMNPAARTLVGADGATEGRLLGLVTGWGADLAKRVTETARDGAEFEFEPD